MLQIDLEVSCILMVGTINPFSCPRPGSHFTSPASPSQEMRRRKKMARRRWRQPRTRNSLKLKTT
jgi:hypothetical protein